MFLAMKEENSTPKAGNAGCWGMGPRPKGTGCMTETERRYSTVGMWFDEQGTGFQKETPNQELSPEKSSDQKAITNPEREPVEIDCGGDLTEETPEGEENPDGVKHPASVPRMPHADSGLVW